MDRNTFTAFLLIFLAVALWLGAIIGYIANIVWLFSTETTLVASEFWIALFGVFIPPLGIIHGWVYIL